MLRDRENDFWGEIERFAGIPRPPQGGAAMPELSKNQSLNEHALKVMREFNKWHDLFSQNAEVVVHKNAKVAFDIVRFEVRYNLQLYPEKLARVLGPVAETLPSCLADDQHLDHSLLARMKDQFADFFHGSDFFGYKEQYCSLA